MTWMLIAAVFVAGTLATFTDWLFMGVLFHDAHLRYPEVWWPGIREGIGNRSAIVWSSVVGYVMSAGVIALCVLTHTGGIASCLIVAVVAWLAGPFVVIVINGFFMKIDPRITFAHCLGWLARMAIAGVAAGLVLAPP